MSTDPTRLAVGTWSGGRFMHFGEAVDDERFLALLTPDARIPTIITADVYGSGEADTWVARALAASALSREAICVVGAVGHDFYTGERDGAKGFPRFTDPRLRGPDGYAEYLRAATERSLERCGVDRFDLLLLHNPDRTGYTSETVWDGMQALRDAGLTRLIGVAPGPANGFTLDLIDCFERFGDRIDWAMVILNPLEPWPGELCLAAAARSDVRVITRVVDYGGLFYDDLTAETELGRHDHRAFRPSGWIDAGRARIERMRPIAAGAGLTLIQLACAWNLTHEPVRTVVPTLVQEAGGGARAVEDKRAELAALPDGSLLTPAQVEAIRRIGDNTGSMHLKGATPEHDGEERPDSWALHERLLAVARRWDIDPARDLVKA
ncbi:MAG TPA: aldo/keto reductase [Solirubrobacteraceae bacterium]|nr:aldo/keto reductase [Solirubrobacteraceae bacterium]